MINFKIINFRPDRTFRDWFVTRANRVERVRPIGDSERDYSQEKEKNTSEEKIGPHTEPATLLHLEHDYEELHHLEDHPIHEPHHSLWQPPEMIPFPPIQPHQKK